MKQFLFTFLMFSFGILIFQESAKADDFLNVADGQKVHITIAKRDMSRLSLVNDRIKSIVIADSPLTASIGSRSRAVFKLSFSQKLHD